MKREGVEGDDYDYCIDDHGDNVDNYDDDNGQVEGGEVEEEQQRDHLELHLHHEDEAEHGL